MFASLQPLFRVAGHTVLIYLFLIVALRVLGHRQLGQLTVLDLVIIIILGSAVETAMIGSNTSLPTGLVSAGTLLATNRLLNLALCRSRRLRHLVEGHPILLVNQGHFVEEHL